MTAEHHEALRQLRRADPRLKQVLRHAPSLKPARQQDLFRGLVAAIIAQQISAKAADTIHRRFLGLFPRRRPTPERLARLSAAQLKAVGISRQKFTYLKSLARFALHGGLDRKRLRNHSDEEAIQHLTRIKGVGRWTAEMLLMFVLGRPDVFPVADLGIQMAVKRLYGLRSAGPRLRARMEQLAQKWKPHRTLVSRCLWAWRRN